MVLDQVRVPLSGKKMFDTSIHNTFVRRSVTIGFALLLIVVSHAALAVSFDCSKAVYETERAICQSPLLRDLDDTLAAAYGRARVSSSEASTIKDQQVEWVRVLQTLRLRCGLLGGSLPIAYRTARRSANSAFAGSNSSDLKGYACHCSRDGTSSGPKATGPIGLCGWRGR